MRYLSVCSGIEAATVAWHPLGWQPLAFSEIEPFPAAVLAHHYPTVPNLGDMTKFMEWSLPDGSVDLLVGGTPCQSFSVAGLRKGLADPRGNLMLTYLAIAQRHRPRWIVWENVPGVLSSNRGRDFGTFLGALGDLGYGWSYRVLDAQWFGVAQRRRRVFVVGHLGDATRAAAVLFESESVRRNTPPNSKKEKEHANLEDGSFSGVWWDGGQLSQTLDAVLFKRQCLPEKNRFPAVLVPAWAKCECCEDYLCNIHHTHAHECDCPSIDEWADKNICPYDPCVLRYLTETECERLMGFPDGYTDLEGCTQTARYKALGNSMATPVMSWIGERIARVEAGLSAAPAKS